MDDFNKVLNSFRCVVPDGLMVFIHEAFLTKPTAKPDRGSDVLPQGKKVFDADARPTYPDGHPTLAWKFGPNNAVVPDHEGRPLAHYDEDECADSDARALADGIRAYLTNMPHGLGYQRLELGSPPMAGAEDAWPPAMTLAPGQEWDTAPPRGRPRREELENCPGNFPLGLIFTDEAIPLRPQFETMLRSLYADLNVAIRLARPIDWETDDPCSPTGTLTATAAVDKEAESLLVRTPYQPIYEGAVRATWAGVRFQPPSTIVAGSRTTRRGGAIRHPVGARAGAGRCADRRAATAPQQARPRRNAGQAVGRGGRGQGHQRGGRHRGRDGRGHRDRGGDRGGGQAQPAQPAVDPNDPFGLDAFLARQQGLPPTLRELFDMVWKAQYAEMPDSLSASARAEQATALVLIKLQNQMDAQSASSSARAAAPPSGGQPPTADATSASSPF
eukprot:tig00000246_g21525.t1